MTRKAESAAVPNAATRKAMAEADEILRAGKLRFRDSDELFAELKAGR